MIATATEEPAHGDDPERQGDKIALSRYSRPPTALQALRPHVEEQQSHETPWGEGTSFRTKCWSTSTWLTKGLFERLITHRRGIGVLMLFWRQASASPNMAIWSLLPVFGV